MGAAPSIPTPEIQEIATTTMTTFTPFYIKGYAGALVKMLRREANPVPNPYKLMTIVPPAAPIKTGVLVKQGGSRKSWKSRFFIVRNLADNYVVEYYVDEAASNVDKAVPRGRIHLCNMQVKRVKDAEDVVKYGAHCLKLKPSGRRRTWYIRCPDAAAQKQWKATFKYCAKQADAPLNKDECMRAAFELAYEETRSALGVWSWYRCDCTEEELLGQLIVDKCERDLMGEVYAKIPAGALYWKLRGAVEKALDTTVGVVVAAAWKVMAGTIEASKGTLKTTASAAIGDVITKQVEIQVAIKAGLMGAMAPALDKIGTTIAPVIEAMAKPMYKAYRLAVKTYVIEMTKVVTSEKMAESANDMYDSIRWYWGITWPSLERVRVLTRPGSSDQAKVKKMGIKIVISDVLQTFGDVSLWRIEECFEEHIRLQMTKAVFTCLEDIKASADTPKDVVMKRTATKLIHDAKIQAKADINMVLFDLIYKYVQKLVNPAMAAVLDPLAALVPGPLEPLLDVKDLAREVLEQTLKSAIDAMMEPAFSTEVDKLNKLVAKLSLPLE